MWAIARLPLVTIAALVQAGRDDELPTVRPDVYPGRQGFVIIPDWRPAFRMSINQVFPAAAGQAGNSHAIGNGQYPVAGHFLICVLIHHHKIRRPGRNADIGRGPPLPPLADLRRVY